jgi:hypothetical protein
MAEAWREVRALAAIRAVAEATRKPTWAMINWTAWTAEESMETWAAYHEKSILGEALRDE